jgi:hypothetical protein
LRDLALDRKRRLTVDLISLCLVEPSAKLDLTRENTLFGRLILLLDLLEQPIEDARYRRRCESGGDRLILCSRPIRSKITWCK